MTGILAKLFINRGTRDEPVWEEIHMGKPAKRKHRTPRWAEVMRWFGRRR